MKNFLGLKCLILFCIILFGAAASFCVPGQKTKTAVHKAEPVKSEFISSNGINPVRYIKPVFSNVEVDKNILYKQAKK